MDVSAVEPGAASSVAPGEIDELETTLARVSVTNPSRLVGRDEERGEDLVVRCLAKRGTWSSLGPRDAYVDAALSATLAGGLPTSITRVAVSRSSSTGTVRLICATPTGAPTEAELDAVREAVEQRARPDTVTVLVEAAVPVATVHHVIIWCRGGTKETILARSQAAMSEFVSRYPIGGNRKIEIGPGYLFADAISGAVLGALRYGEPKVDAYDLDFVGGAVDVPLALNEVATNTTIFEVRVIA